MVASDLSPQATYAMEWAIGTVLREGDTLHVAQALGKDDEPYEEMDRETNCKALAEEVKRLLKRTRLQVKVHVEIVAAKTPKHMITEMVLGAPLSSSVSLLTVLCRSIILIRHWLFWVLEVVPPSKISSWVHSLHTSLPNRHVPSWSPAKNSRNRIKRASVQPVLPRIRFMEDSRELAAFRPLEWQIISTSSHTPSWMKRI